jgi:hypothetical protein
VSSSSCCSTVNILAVSVGGFDLPRGFVVLVVVDLGCGGGGGGLVTAKMLVLIARSMESQSNTGKIFSPDPPLRAPDWALILDVTTLATAAACQQASDGNGGSATAAAAPAETWERRRTV